MFPEEGWAAETLASFFERLARSSERVSPDAVSWKGEEDELTLTATHPLMNTMLLRVRLQCPEMWAAEVTLETDPGVYREVARIVRDLSRD